MAKPIERQVILITGATDGIGKETARELAAEGATVLLHGRNADRCGAIREQIVEETNNQDVDIVVADLASLAEVRRLAEDVLARHDRLDVLINNAGIGSGGPTRPNREASADGHELRFAVNHLAPFLLTHLLLPALEAGAPSRIVNVTSAAQRQVDFDDVMLATGYSGYRAYSQSKLAMVMATIEFAGRLKGKGITVNCVHPGTLLDTKTAREFGPPQGTVEEGVRSEVFLATADALDGVTGEYFDQTRRARADAQAYDRAARRRLWQLSERLTGIGR